MTGSIEGIENGVIQHRIQNLSVNGVLGLVEVSIRLD